MLQLHTILRPLPVLMETGTIIMDTLNLSPFMLVYSWHVKPEGANVKPDEDSDTANHDVKYSNRA
jgi:hypothetical protein